MSRILLVDDEPQLVHALRRALEQSGHEVVAAGDGETGIQLAATSQPDLVVLDLKLPDLDGVEVVRRLRPWLDARILILSAVTDETRKVQALDAGADDYLIKPFGIRELTARLRALLRRASPGAEERSLEFPGMSLDLAARTVQVDGADRRLTPTEWRILEALATQPGKLLSHRWLLHQVWDETHGDEARQSLRSHVRSLRRKLDDDASAPRFIGTESGAGYRWLPFPDSDDEPPADPRDRDLDEGEGTEQGFGARTGADGQQRGFPEVLHDLNNVLTAMRFAAYLGSRETADGTGASDRAEEVAARWQVLVLRASDLARELARTH